MSRKMTFSGLLNFKIFRLVHVVCLQFIYTGREQNNLPPQYQNMKYFLHINCLMSLVEVQLFFYLYF